MRRLVLALSAVVSLFVLAPSAQAWPFTPCRENQYYRDAYIEEVWGVIPNIGPRVVNVIYHNATCQWWS